MYSTSRIRMACLLNCKNKNPQGNTSTNIKNHWQFKIQISPDSPSHCCPPPKNRTHWSACTIPPWKWSLPHLPMFSQKCSIHLSFRLKRSTWAWKGKGTLIPFKNQVAPYCSYQEVSFSSLMRCETFTTWYSGANCVLSLRTTCSDVV